MTRNASASPAFEKECAKPLHVTLTSIRLTVELLIFITYSSPLADGWRGEQFTFTLSPRTHRDNSESPSEFSPADNHYPTRCDRRSVRAYDGILARPQASAIIGAAGRGVAPGRCRRRQRRRRASPTALPRRSKRREHWRHQRTSGKSAAETTARRRPD